MAPQKNTVSSQIRMVPDIVDSLGDLIPDNLPDTFDDSMELQIQNPHELPSGCDTSRYIYFWVPKRKDQLPAFAQALMNAKPPQCAFVTLSNHGENGGKNGANGGIRKDLFSGRGKIESDDSVLMFATKEAYKKADGLSREHIRNKTQASLEGNVDPGSSPEEQARRKAAKIQSHNNVYSPKEAPDASTLIEKIKKQTPKDRG